MPEVISLAYADGRPVKPGDLVTGAVDCGSFPAEPFLAQVVDIFPSNHAAEIVFLCRSQSLNTAARFFQRQTNVANVTITMYVQVTKPTLRCRASQPVSKDAKSYQPLPRPGRLSWGRQRSFGYRV